MKNKKLIITTLSLVMLSSFVFWTYNQRRDNQVTKFEERNDWITIKKENNKEIITPSSQIELELARISEKESHPQPVQDRLPSSTPPAKEESEYKKEMEKVLARLPELEDGRSWQVYPGQPIPPVLSFRNKRSKDWKKKLGNSVMRFLKNDTKLFLKEMDSLSILERDKARFVEKVSIRIQSPQGRLNSYNALVDSETGEIVKTWNQTIHESMTQNKNALKLRASGGLNTLD